MALPTYARIDTLAKILVKATYLALAPFWLGFLLRLSPSTVANAAGAYFYLLSAVYVAMVLLALYGLQMIKFKKLEQFAIEYRNGAKLLGWA